MKLNRLLSVFLIGIFTLIVFLTAIFLFTKKAEPGKNLVKKSEFQQIDSKSNQTYFKSKEKSTFSNIGQLRVSTKPDSKNNSEQNSAVVVITPWLEYSGNDSDFYAELDSKTSKMRSIIQAYICAHTLKELNQKGEAKVKQELLSSINSILVLKKIESIYFTEYQFL